jgi:aspartate carbamoyltransferase catalytic subunit
LPAAKFEQTTSEKEKKKNNKIIIYHPTPNRTKDFLLILKQTTILSKADAHHVPRVLASLSTLGYYIL